MRRALALLALTALVLAGCGGDDSSSSGSTTTKASGDGTTTTTKASDDDGGSGSGDVDCTAVKAAMAKFIVGVQLVGQVRSLETLQSLKEGTIGDFDIDEFLGEVATLKVLEGHTSVLGDPADSLATYQDAGDKLKVLLDEAAPTEADIQAYGDAIGSVGEFLGKQTAIAGALDDAGC